MPGEFDTFERYRGIVDDWEAFTNALSRPHPTCIWANPLRTTPEALERRMSESDVAFTPLPWYTGAYRLASDVSPGNHLAYLTGLYHVQEEVSLLPVFLLDPLPGERVLDLCAAPGSKTAQMAVRMQNRGTIVANDRSRHRLRALFTVLARLGVANVSTTVYDAANYPKESGHFDRVLADVPCSCEGTSRKNPDVCSKLETDSFRRLTGLQEAILRKAVQLCKPGGRIAYATCTYAPEENEAIVHTILEEHGDDRLRLLPARVDGFVSSPGLTSWQDKPFHPSLERTMRVWPHQNDTGGFFVALLEKLSD